LSRLLWGLFGVFGCLFDYVLFDPELCLIVGNISNIKIRLNYDVVKPLGQSLPCHYQNQKQRQKRIDIKQNR